MSMIPPTSLGVRIANRLQEIERLKESFTAFATRHAVPESIRRDVLLVLDELLNNIISYAYEDDAEHIIDLNISLSEGRLAITLTDDGRAFNPFQREAPDTTLSVEDRPIGGLGVHLVTKLMDLHSYERRGEKNCVSLEKFIG